MFYLNFAFPGQLSFQLPASNIMEGIIDLHHNIFFFLILVLTQVLSIFFVIILRGNIGWERPKYDHVIKYQKNYLVLNALAHGALLEIVWTIIPSIILMLIAIPSFALLYSVDSLVEPQYTIKVVGHQWYWSYDYAGGIIYDSYMLPFSSLNIGDLRLLEVDRPLICPTNVYLRFIITSLDVLHSFAIPALGVKVDAVPGRLNQVFCYIKREGVFYGQCSELCGVNHGFMPIKIIALNVPKFEKFLNS